MFVKLAESHEDRLVFLLEDVTSEVNLQNNGEGGVGVSSSSESNVNTLFHPHPIFSKQILAKVKSFRGTVSLGQRSEGNTDVREGTLRHID